MLSIGGSVYGASSRVLLGAGLAGVVATGLPCSLAAVL
jgi:hypothetical protein